MRIVWLTRARTDFDHQIRHIAKYNPSAAAEQDALISEAVDRLATYPHFGRLGCQKFSRELVMNKMKSTSSASCTLPRSGRRNNLFN